MEKTPKIAVTSIAAEQLARKNIAEPNGWPFFHEFQYGDLWGNPLNPEDGLHPDVVIFKGFFVNDYKTLHKHKLLLGDPQHHFQPKSHTAEKIIMLWAGSDVYQLFAFVEHLGRYEAKIFQELRSDRYCHIPVSEKQKKELWDMFKIKATEPLPTPARTLFQPLPFKGRPTVSVYMPPHRSPFFKYGMIRKVAEKLPGINFIFYHWLFEGDALASAEITRNVEHRYACTRQEYEQIVADSWAALRIPETDGLSSGAAEFLMANRPVFSNHDMPHYPKKVDRKVITVDYLVELLADLAPSVPEDVQERYRDIFNPDLFVDRLNARISTKWPEFRLQKYPKVA